jgi:uncharacterized membrane protein YvbJ
MTKYCKKCYKAFADRFSYCALCGSSLDMYDGKWKDDTNITHKDIIQKIVEYEKSSKLFSAQVFLYSIVVAFLILFLTTFNFYYLLIALLPYVLGGIFIYKNYKLLKESKFK